MTTKESFELILGVLVPTIRGQKGQKLNLLQVTIEDSVFHDSF